jgi:hypothetical protein
VVEAVDRARRVGILDRAAGETGRGSQPDGFGRILRLIAKAVFKVSATIAAAFAMMASRPSAPSRNPAENAAPALVEASASNPSAARMRAEPASHGLGMTKAPGRSCRARNAATLAAVLLVLAIAHPPDLLAPSLPRSRRLLLRPPP